MASLYDVARRAGVSKTLVSRFINGRSGVSPTSREKIILAMKELDYTPNALARSLALRKTGTIGVVLDSLCESYFFDFIQGVEQTVEQLGYEVVFCSGQADPLRKARRVEYLSQGRTDGLILYGSYLDDTALIEEMCCHSFPFVVVEHEGSFPGINTILVDNIRGGAAAVEHLAAQGCRNIWHFTGDSRRTVAGSRLEGYRRGMASLGFPVEPHMIVTSDFTVQSGYLQMGHILRHSPHPLPDGIFFAADITAYGALQALQEAGISVPGQIKLVGYDNDTAYASFPGMPGLSTVSQPLADMGALAVKYLAAAIEGKVEQPQSHTFTPHLIIRDSSTAGR